MTSKEVLEGNRIFNCEVFGNHIRGKRKYNSISLDELAKELGISKATISRVENGKEPSINTALTLAHWYGTGLEYFINIENK